jgi:hypothetical protein
MVAARAVASGSAVCKLDSVDDRTHSTLDDARRAQGEFVRAELELGATFLDVALTTRDAGHSLRCVRNAIAALRTADRYMAHALYAHLDDAEIYRLRDQLEERVRKLIRGAPAIT